MTATVRLDTHHEKLLEEVAEQLHKKKSEILREALDFYAKHVLSEKRRRMDQAVERVKEAERKEMEFCDGTIDDAL